MRDAMLRPCDAACTVGAQSAEHSPTSSERFTSTSPCYQEWPVDDSHGFYARLYMTLDTL